MGPRSTIPRAKRRRPASRSCGPGGPPAATACGSTPGPARSGSNRGGRIGIMTALSVLRPAGLSILLSAWVAAEVPPATPAPAVATPAKAKEGQTCGTIRGIVCEDGLWCDPRPGACRGADLDGTCIKVPEVCTQE